MPKANREIHTFSSKGNGFFAGGGHITISFPNQRNSSLAKASQLLKQYQSVMAFWQVSQTWIVSIDGRDTRIEGFSPAQSKLKTSKNDILRALQDSATNAAKRQGLNLNYEGKSPGNVRPVGQEWKLIVWFMKEARHRFVSSGA